MSERIEHRLLVELVGRAVHDYRTVDKVFHPVGSTTGIQRHIPIGPARHPMI